jgi:hypothetical protein
MQGEFARRASGPSSQVPDEGFDVWIVMQRPFQCTKVSFSWFSRGVARAVSSRTNTRCPLCPLQRNPHVSHRYSFHFRSEDSSVAREAWSSPTSSWAAKRPRVQNSPANAFADLHRCVVRTVQAGDNRAYNMLLGSGRSGWVEERGSMNAERPPTSPPVVRRRAFPPSICPPSPTVAHRSPTVSSPAHRRPPSPTPLTVAPPIRAEEIRGRREGRGVAAVRPCLEL